LLLGDRYRALKSISQGGLGRTFLAVDEQQATKPRCIIKQFPLKNQGTNNAEKAAELFRIEATRLQELGQHPQIPQLLACFEQDDRTGIPAALVQSLIEGESIAQILEAEGAFSETQIRQLLNEILPVLQFVHDRGVIHRDINPENIIRRTPPTPLAKGGEQAQAFTLAKEGEQGTAFTLAKGGEQAQAFTLGETGEGQLVLVDFGAAKFTTKTALAKTGTVIGSAAYTAQEQLMGKAVTSSDLYSLGVTCIHLLTHIHPFDLFNSLEGVWVWQDYLTNPVSNELKQILNKMVEGTVKYRYQSAEEVLKSLNPELNLKTLIQPKTAIPSLLTALKTLIPTWNCVRTLTGHLSSITSTALTSDGKTLVSGSADRTVKLWNPTSKIPINTLSGHSRLIDAVTLTPDGRILVSGSWDHTIKIWALETGELIRTLSQHSGWIKSLAISPNGQHLISGSADRTIKIWNLGTGEVQATLSGHSSAVHSVAISPDGCILASGSADKTIKLWNLGSGEVQLTLDGHSDAVNSLAFSPSGQILMSGSGDKTIKLWNLGNGELLQTLNGHSEAVNSIAINLQGNVLISGSADKTLKIWHPGSGELMHTLSGHSAGVTTVAISLDSRLIASGSQDQTVKIWQFE
jgi:WD40 repeat protein